MLPASASCLIASRLGSLHYVVNVCAALPGLLSHLGGEGLGLTASRKILSSLCPVPRW